MDIISIGRKSYDISDAKLYYDVTTQLGRDLDIHSIRSKDDLPLLVREKVYALAERGGKHFHCRYKCPMCHHIGHFNRLTDCVLNFYTSRFSHVRVLCSNCELWKDHFAPRGLVRMYRSHLVNSIIEGRKIYLSIRLKNRTVKYIHTDRYKIYRPRGILRFLMDYKVECYDYRTNSILKGKNVFPGMDEYLYHHQYKIPIKISYNNISKFLTRNEQKYLTFLIALFYRYELPVELAHLILEFLID